MKIFKISEMTWNQIVSANPTLKHVHKQEEKIPYLLTFTRCYELNSNVFFFRQKLINHIKKK